MVDVGNSSPAYRQTQRLTAQVTWLGLRVSSRLLLLLLLLLLLQFLQCQAVQIDRLCEVCFRTAEWCITLAIRISL